MKSILISIKPRFVGKILNGDKTIEVRKSMPKCDLPIDVYIYCTKDKGLLHKNCADIYWLEDKNFQAKNKKLGIKTQPYLNGKVVAKFTLNKVEEITPQMWTPKIEQEILEKSCLKENELFDYICSHDGTEDKPFYAWNISNLIIFDKPKELWEFNYWNVVKNNKYIYGEFPLKTQLTKAPKSWQFIETGDK